MTDGQMMVVRVAALSTAVLAGLLVAFGTRVGILDLKPGGATFDAYIRPAFLGVLAVGVVAALRWELVGGCIVAFAAAALIGFATKQLETGDAVLVVAAFAVPAALWIFIDIHDLQWPFNAVPLAVALALAMSGYFVGTGIYDSIWGPTHPGSSALRSEGGSVEWVWTGGVGTDRATVAFKTAEPFLEAVVTATPVGGGPPVAVDVAPAGTLVAQAAVLGLEAGTEYVVEVQPDGLPGRSATFTTFEPDPDHIRLAFGACARVGSNGAVFDTIRDADPDLYVIIGDFHYGDNSADDIADYREVLDVTLTRPGQAALYESTPIAYVWDDHDYGANDSDGSSISRPAAMAAYREYVPSYPLAAVDSAVYQAFSVGSVRVVMTDARASRDPASAPDGPDKTMLGEDQLAWLVDELPRAAASHDLVIWVNPVPWIGEPDAGADSWAGYAHERRLVANAIAAAGIDNLLMVSGDAHMVAIDDGSNTDYSDRGEASFPLLHAAALDRPGGSKGGPYSEGRIAGGGQFGLIDVTRRGDALVVRLEAQDWTGAALLEYEFSVESKRP